MANRKYVRLVGSERTPLAARRIGPVADDEPIEVSVYVRRRAPLPAPTAGAARLTRAALAAQYGADPVDIAKVERHAAALGLRMVESDPARCVVVLGGPASVFKIAFEVELDHYDAGGARYRGRTGALHIGEELAGVVTAVLGLDDRQQAVPYVRPWRGAAPENVFTGKDVARLYQFPEGDGSGQCIAMIELGGGYRRADLTAYWGDLGIAPRVSGVSIDGARNMPTGEPSGADGEVMLDIEVAAAVAPGAEVVVYFAPNTARGFVDAISRAVHDPTNQPSVISISWGSPESAWTDQAIAAMDEALRAAAAVGVTVCAASGDHGASDGVGDHHAHTDHPASNPHVLGCGGTRLVAARGAITSETVWNDEDGATGGGVSDKFPLPTYQTGARVPPSSNPGHRVGRGVPDVSGVADPRTGYRVRVDAQMAVLGGTSAVAPLWAGLIALVNQARGRPVGFLHPLLYQHPEAMRNVTQGNNRGYPAYPGWNACTGLGSPNGAALLACLAR